MPETQDRRRRGKRLLPKLASLAIQHAELLIAASCICGLIALLLLPALAKSTYISENALMPGSASPKFVHKDAAFAAQIAREVQSLSRNMSKHGLLAIQRFLLSHLSVLGADFYLHSFDPPEEPLSSINFFGSRQPSLSGVRKRNAAQKDFETVRTNVVGLLRAPHGEGNEAIVLVTPFNSGNITQTDAVSLGLGLALFRLLSKVPWLAKDIMWLAADSYYGLHFAVSTWLKEYHEPVCFNSENLSDSLEPLPEEISFYLNEINVVDFKRAGVISAGIVFNVQEEKSKGLTDSLTVYAEGPNGQMPNLDLINVVNNLAVYREGLQMQLDMATSMLECYWLHSVGRVFEVVGHVVGFMNPAWKFGSPSGEYTQGAATLTRSLSLQALGIPTGAHGAFRDYQIDAVTVTFSARVDAQGGPVASLIKFGRLLEGMIRSLNNLLEKFHQSFFLYFLTGSNKFVSVGVYMIPLLLLLVTLPLKAAALCNESAELSNLSTNIADMNETGSQGAIQEWASGGNSLSFARWSFAVATVCAVLLGATLGAMFPLFAYHIVESSGERLLLWIGFLSFNLLVSLLLLRKLGDGLGLLKDTDQSEKQWKALKASMLGMVTIGIGILSAINFATALLGAVLLVPMSITITPIQLFNRNMGFRSLMGALMSTSFIVLSFSPLIANLEGLNATIMWSWVESMWRWGSATYLYFFLVHLPCLVLCLLLLLSNKV